MSCDAEAETAASSVQQPEDRDVWDGSMQWLPNTDAVCRELPM